MDESQSNGATANPEASAEVDLLQRALLENGPREAADALRHASDPPVVEALLKVSPVVAGDALWELEASRRERLLATMPPDRRAQLVRNRTYPEDSIGRLMESPIATFLPDDTVGEVVERLRTLVKRSLVIYGWVTDRDGRLVGLLIFRELLFAGKHQKLEDMMLRSPFALSAAMSVEQAMKAVVTRHFPAYPVLDERGVLVGVVRGQSLFEQHAFELSAQPGRMVGIEDEERVSTPWWRSLRSRHPWLQLNLLTAFVAAAVVSAFQGTIDRLVLLAAFLPVLAGQSGNTGCQALAVTLRGMTLGELDSARQRRAIAKELILGLCNGLMVGVTAGLGMYAYARSQSNPAALTLALVVLMAMTCSCIVSGIAGTVIPLTLKRFGADPATASSIFLTTATDVVSMGVFLGLASILVPG